MTGPMPTAPATDYRRETLRLRRLGIDTHQEAVVFMRSDCHVCRAEGFTAHTRVVLHNGARSITATLYQVTSEILHHNEAGLSEAAWRLLGAKVGDEITVGHPAPVLSKGLVRAKMFGESFGAAALAEIVRDIVAGHYSDIELSAFITACAARGLDHTELVSLTRAMVGAGSTLTWSRAPIVDKHSVGGLPGNRTTPIVVAIAAACGLTMPKTSSRAITSPAGTADTMETMTPVDLDLATMRRVVEQEGGCMVWGGAMRLSPADDVLIRVERALDLDSEGQLIASVLSKKIAAGSTHVVLDIPVGPTAKVRSAEAARVLSESLVRVADAFGLALRIVLSDGSQPVGRGIGPALEALDVLAVLKGAHDAPADLRQRSLTLAAAVLELGGAAPTGGGAAAAEVALSDGHAWTKFQRICEAQGGFREPPTSSCQQPILAPRAGRVLAIDNRRLAKVAKLSGAPDDKAAGVQLHAKVGETVAVKQPLYTIHAESPGELAYALEFATAMDGIVFIGEP